MIINDDNNNHNQKDDDIYRETNCVKIYTQYRTTGNPPNGGRKFRQSSFQSEHVYKLRIFI